MPRVAVLAAVTACLATAISGCSSTPEAPPTGSTTTAPVTVPTGLTPAPSDVPEQHDDGSTGSPKPGSSLVLDDAARASAIEHGTKVMTLFARRDVPATQWQADLASYLTPQAATAYQYVDPKNVPPTKITGTVTLTPASTPLVARVSVPTDAGVYLVIMSRSDDSPTWLADRIMPPEGSGDS